MKFFHNDKVSLGWAILVELVVHGLFAFGSLLLGDFMGEIVLGKNGQAIGGIILAVFIFGAAFQAFVLGEYTREHVVAYEGTAKGNGSYLWNWKAIQWIVGGLEVSSLAFRCIVVLTQGNWLQAVVVAIFGGLALWYAYAQAKVIHASVNRPVEYDVMQAQQRAGRSLVKDAIDYTSFMLPEEKARFAGGDPTAVGNAVARIRDEERRQEESRNTQELARRRVDEEKQAQHERAKEVARNIFDPRTWGKRQPDLPTYTPPPTLDFQPPDGDWSKVLPPSGPFPKALTNEARRQSQNGHQK
jgi:hypothetical protein